MLEENDLALYSSKAMVLNTYFGAAVSGFSCGAAHQTWQIEHKSESFDRFTRYLFLAIITSTASATLVAAIAKVAGVHFSRPGIEKLALPALKISAHGASFVGTFILGSCARSLIYNFFNW